MSAQKQTRMFTRPNGDIVGLCINTNALVMLEEQFDVAITEIGDAFSSPSLGKFRTFVYCALEGWRLREAVDRDPFTQQDAGNIFDEFGGLAGGGAEMIIELFNDSGVISVSLDDNESSKEQTAPLAATDKKQQVASTGTNSK